MIAVDTNILVYAVDRGDPAKQLVAQQLLLRLRNGAEPTCLLWQVLGEFIQQLRRWRDQGKLSDPEFVQHVNSHRLLFPIVFPDEDVLDHALSLANRYSLSHWDSMLLGACQAAGISTIYTEDMGASRQIDQIQLINPF